MIENNNTLRVTGLASGMNTDEIVTNLVKVQSARLNKLTQNKTLADWKTDAYRDVNKKVDEFRKSMEALRLQSTFNKQVTTSSNDSVVSGTVSGVPTQSSYEISNVQQAKPATATSVKFFLEGTLDTTKKLSELGVVGNANGEASLKVNGKTYTFSIEDNLSKVFSEINIAGTSTLSYSATEKSLTFSNKELGESDITISGSPNLLKALGIVAGSTSDQSYQNAANMSVTKGTSATQAKMWINGLEFRSDTNKITYDGMTFEIKDNMTGTLTVTNKNDTSGIFESIKTFVDKYNELIADLNGRLSEKKYRDYPPLLDEQKKDLKENEIKLWEEKAKSGLLTNDSTIQTLINEMRNSLGSVIESSTGFKSFKEIGINFSNNYMDKGKLVLDEAKLKGVLETNLEDVKKLFTFKGGDDSSSSTTVTDKAKHDQSGFAWRLYDRINVTISQLGSLAGSPNTSVDTKSFMAKQIKALDESIDREQHKISAYEARLWKQFSMMEKALQQLNSQGSWLSQQLGM
ncbi:flagellar hook-associated protein 2 [Bacillus niacini]|uniref:Flagellar hook-associated protein 2 n=1 Tax=Neobacillus niacini TaxID=86668 RepID=A0A852TD72_9BACI|nr:flagellar filament capping protein FliD [Neobacillus niacini]NYE06743.1 flagellar hook-associated protein 2 [Neobacillus niacini]